MNSQALIFLTYIPRSGSTLLARLLNEYETLAVSKSGKFPDGLTTPSLPLQAEVEKVTDILFEDPHFSGWGLTRQEVINTLSALDKPIEFKTLLPAMLKAYFDKNEIACKHVVYKNNRYIHHIQAIRERYPDSRFIFMLRDPRGIFNSTRQHLDIRTGSSMNINPALAAHIFNRACKQVRKYMHQPWFHFLRYEDLVTHPEREVGRLLSFVGIEDDQSSHIASDYTIPDDQKGLHQNVSQPPNKAIASKWQHELPGEDAWIIQSSTSNELASFNYDLLYYPKVPFSWRIKKYRHLIPVAIMRTKQIVKGMLASRKQDK